MPLTQCPAVESFEFGWHEATVAFWQSASVQAIGQSPNASSAALYALVALELELLTGTWQPHGSLTKPVHEGAFMATLHSCAVVSALLAAVSSAEQSAEPEPPLPV